MIKRKVVEEFLDRAVEAHKLCTQRIIVDGKSVYSVGNCLLINNVELLAKALNRPYVRKSFTESSDKISFHWKGYEVYDIDFNKRIAHIKA